MKEKLIYFAKLTSMAILSFIKINGIGLISIVLVSILSFIALSKNIGAEHTAHISALPYLIMIFTAKPISSVLFYLTFIASPILLFILGNKYILNKLIHKLLSDEAEMYIYPILDKLFTKIKGSQAHEFVKEKLIQQLKNENENKWLKKIIKYGLKKVNLNDLDFDTENESISEQLKPKIIQALKEASAPSRNSIWLLLLAQWLVLVLIWVLLY